MLDGLFAGLDVSTQSCKLVVIEPTTARVVHVDAVNYDEDVPHYETDQGTITGLGEGVSESDPRMWIEAVEIVLGGLGASRVDALDRRVGRAFSQLETLFMPKEASEVAAARAAIAGRARF